MLRLAIDISMNSKAYNHQAAAAVKSLSPLTVVGVALCLALVLAVLALGVNTFHGCHHVQIPMDSIQRSTVRLYISKSTSKDHGHGAINSAAAAEIAANKIGTRQSNGTAASHDQHKQRSFKDHSSHGLVVSHVPFKLPVQRGLPSDAWRPHVYSECVAGMPQGYAPCLKYSNLLHGEELLYPGMHF